MVSLVIRGSLTSTSDPSTAGARLSGEFWMALATALTSWGAGGGAVQGCGGRRWTVEGRSLGAAHPKVSSLRA
jgi:hypothetical protein